MCGGQPCGQWGGSTAHIAHQNYFVLGLCCHPSIEVLKQNKWGDSS